jgi:hypothetical protein
LFGQFPDAPAALVRSMEADLYPLSRPELADKVDGAMGEGSHFHQTHGYFAQGVSPNTATLHKGWRQRLVRIENRNTGGYVGLCLEVHDLAISKYIAGREKNREFTRELARLGMTYRQTLLERLAVTKLDAAASKIAILEIWIGLVTLLISSSEGVMGPSGMSRLSC